MDNFVIVTERHVVQGEDGSSVAALVHALGEKVGELESRTDGEITKIEVSAPMGTPDRIASAYFRVGPFWPQP
jgi:hypothetical protein